MTFERTSHQAENQENRTIRLERERLGSLHKQIVEQFKHIDGVIEFFEQHRDSFFAISELGQILMKYNLLACGPLLPKHFADIPINGNLEETKKALHLLGNEEAKKRWLTFLTQARQLTTNALASCVTDTASWVIGQEQSPYPARRAPEARVLNPTFLEESIPADLDALALFLTQEKIGKRIEAQFEETWLSNKREQTQINPDVRSEDIKRVFGNADIDSLYDLLPDELQGAIAKLEIISPLEIQTVESHGNVDQVQLDGQFDKNEKTMRLVIRAGQTMERVLETWFHELGHALITGSTQIDRDIRKKFALSVVKSKMISDCYASDIYDAEGIERGLEEDFAETCRQFFLYPQELEVDLPQRFLVMSNIMDQYCPSFDRKQISKKTSRLARRLLV